MEHVSPSEKTHRKNVLLTTTALFAALICLATAYLFHIPIGVNGGYIHIGDTLIYLAAALLPTPYAMAAGALGGTLADLLTAPIYAPATFLVKMLITLPLTSKSDSIICKRNIIGCLAAALITIGGYSAAEFIMFGSAAAALASIPGNVIQSLGSAVLFAVIGSCLDKAGFKRTFRNKSGV